MKRTTYIETVRLEEPNLCVFKTTKDAKTWFISHRELTSLKESRASFVHRLENEVHQAK